MANSPIEDGEITDDFNSQESVIFLESNDTMGDNYENVNMDIESDSEGGLRAMQKKQIELDEADTLRQLLLSQVSQKKTENKEFSSLPKFNSPPNKKTQCDNGLGFDQIKFEEQDQIFNEIQSNNSNCVREMYAFQKKYYKIQNKCASLEKRRKRFLESVEQCNNDIAYEQEKLAQITVSIISLFKKSSDFNVEKMQEAELLRDQVFGSFSAKFDVNDGSDSAQNLMSRNNIVAENAFKKPKRKMSPKQTVPKMVKKRWDLDKSSNSVNVTETLLAKSLAQKKKNKILEEKLQELERELCFDNSTISSLVLSTTVGSNDANKLLNSNTLSSTLKTAYINENNGQQSLKRVMLPQSKDCFTHNLVKVLPQPVNSTPLHVLPPPPPPPPLFSTIDVNTNASSSKNILRASLESGEIDDDSIPWKVVDVADDERDLEILDEVCSEAEEREKKDEVMEKEINPVFEKNKEKVEIDMLNRMIIRTKKKYAAFATINTKNKEADDEAIQKFRSNIRALNDQAAQFSKPSSVTLENPESLLVETTSSSLLLSSLPAVNNLLTSKSVEKELQNLLVTPRLYRLTQSFPFHLIRHPAVSNKIDPNLPLCPFQLHGRCADEKCPWQHELEYRLTDVEIVCEILSFHPSLCPQGMLPNVYAKKLLDNYSVEHVACFLVSKITVENRLISALNSSDSSTSNLESFNRLRKSHPNKTTPMDVGKKLFLI